MRRALLAVVLVGCSTSAPIAVEPSLTADGGAGDAGGGADASPPPAVGCSGDLQSVVAEGGAVVKTCPPDLGCWEGKCVAACEAAARARGSFGCEFFVPTPVVYGTAGSDAYPPQPCFSAVVVNAWGRSMHLSTSFGGKYLETERFARIPNGSSDPRKWDPVGGEGIPPGKVAVLFLSEDPAGTPVRCPVTPAFDVRTVVNDPNRPLTARGTAFKIETDVPATAYDLVPLGAAVRGDFFGARVPPSFAGGTLLLPTSTWGSAYTAVVPALALTSYPALNTIQVVAAEDDTKVTVSSKVDLPSGRDVPAVMQDFPRTLTLKAGEYVQWFDAGNASGTIFASDKPVELVVGNTRRGAHQVMPPNSSLGFEYVLPPHAHGVDRAAMHAFLLMAINAGTTLSFDPPAPGAPTSLAAGESVVVEVGDATYVKSQDASHPFYAAQCSPDPNFPAVFKCLDFSNLVPPIQYLKRYVFYTDIGYQNTYLTLLRKKDGGRPVDVDCIGSTFAWHDVGIGAAYEYAHADVRLLDEPAYSCQNGGHAAWSETPFGVMVRGFDSATYSYPAGGNVSIVQTGGGK